VTVSPVTLNVPVREASALRAAFVLAQLQRVGVVVGGKGCSVRPVTPLRATIFNSVKSVFQAQDFASQGTAALVGRCRSPGRAARRSPMRSRASELIEVLRNGLELLVCVPFGMPMVRVCPAPAPFDVELLALPPDAHPVTSASATKAVTVAVSLAVHSCLLA